MTEDTKLKIAVAAAGFGVAAVGVAVARRIQKHRLKKPLSGTTKIERIYIIKESKK